MNCILHIGTAKTGTTILQDWLYANREALSAQRVYLSDMLGTTNNRMFPAYFQETLDQWATKRGIATVAEKDAFFADFEERFAGEVAKASQAHDHFVITSEHLHSQLGTQREIDHVRDFLARHFDEVTVVCYFRNQFDMAVSAYSTGLKGSAVDTLEDYLAKVAPGLRYYNFLEIATQWSEAFGKERCVFRIYDRERFVEGDIRRDFVTASLPHVDLGALDYRLTSSNESLSKLQAVAYRAINEKVRFWNKQLGKRDKTNAALKDAISAQPALAVGKVSSDQRAEVEARFAKSNRVFSQTFFEVEDVFDTAGARPPIDPTFTLDEVGEILDAALGAVLPQLDPSRMLVFKDGVVLAQAGDAAMKGKTMSPSDALALYQLARRARPDTPSLEEKIKEARKLARNPKAKAKPKRAKGKGEGKGKGTANTTPAD